MAQALEVDHREHREDREAQDRVDDRPARDLDEDQHNPEDDQRQQRPEGDAGERGEIPSRRVAEGPKPAMKSAVAPPACQTAAGSAET